jgi:rhamnosyltransferase
MATWNGAPWVQEQLDSIAQQRGVQVSLVVSDDGSTDDTPRILQTAPSTGLRMHLCSPPQRTGSAGRNFFHLIANADIGDASHVALADQDDIWFDHKLERAIENLQSSGASGYSSNVYAWYPQRAINQQMALIDKAQPQVALDHLFQSPGPGCTFVMTRAYFLALRSFVQHHRTQVETIAYHDWFIYAHARSTGHLWIIDSQPGMLYRQHVRNEIGASRGWVAMHKRIDQLRQGWLTTEVSKIARLLNQQDLPLVQRATRLHATDRLLLALNVCQLRRSWRDRLALAVAFLLLMPRVRDKTG